MYLLDTDIATLAFFGRNSKVSNRFDEGSDSGTIAITIITWAEIIRGRCESVLKADSTESWQVAEHRLVLTREWLSKLDVIGIGNAGEHFDRFRKNKRIRTTTDLPDLMMACIALANDAILVTRNTKDYTAIAGLRLENWAD
jgi:tRNA(fMet)-specific endonuclease VapC